MGRNVLVTGAAGSVGRMIAEPMREAGHTVLRTDLKPIDGVQALDVTDAAAVAAACRGMDAIVHLGGVPHEATFEEINTINVAGTHNIFLGAVAAGVERVIIASSNHAVGFHRRSESPPGTLLEDPHEPRPDTYYGWGKVANEAMGRMFHDRYGLGVIALRIGSCYPEPTGVRMLATWLSPMDAGRLVNACLDADPVGYHAVWAISANTRRWWSLAGAEALGYRSKEDAETFASALIERYGEPEPADPDLDYVGGHFCCAPLGEPM